MIFVFNEGSSAPKGCGMCGPQNISFDTKDHRTIFIIEKKRVLSLLLKILKIIVLRTNYRKFRNQETSLHRKTDLNPGFTSRIFPTNNFGYTELTDIVKVQMGKSSKFWRKDKAFDEHCLFHV